MFIRPIVLYVCGAWTSTKSDEKRVLMFERKSLCRIYGLKRNEKKNTYEWRSNSEFRAIFHEPNIVGILTWPGWSRMVSRGLNST